jgi:hypothetical protein
MQNTTVLNCHFLRRKETSVAENRSEPCVLESSEIVLSKEEKDYQKLVSEKLKASAEWDVRDSRTFSIR